MFNFGVDVSFEMAKLIDDGRAEEGVEEGVSVPVLSYSRVKELRVACCSSCSECNTAQS
jgi:hypothetical protein